MRSDHSFSPKIEIQGVIDRDLFSRNKRIRITDLSYINQKVLFVNVHIEQ